ncbi:hypothetical protein PFISCL1PPCAC_24449, partial [Pristionchus fissidentatus]
CPITPSPPTSLSPGTVGGSSMPLPLPLPRSTRYRTLPLPNPMLPYLRCISVNRLRLSSRHTSSSSTSNSRRIKSIQTVSWLSSSTTSSNSSSTLQPSSRGRSNSSSYSTPSSSRYHIPTVIQYPYRTPVQAYAQQYQQPARQSTSRPSTFPLEASIRREEPTIVPLFVVFPLVLTSTLPSRMRRLPTRRSDRD